MHQQSLSYSNHIFGSVACDPTALSGRGHVLAPALYVPVTLQLNGLGMTGQQQVGVLVEDITGTAVVGHAGGFELQVAPYSIQRLVMAGSHEERPELRIGILPNQVEAIERTRAAGDIEITLLLRVAYTVVAQGPTGPVFGVVQAKTVVDAGVTSVHLPVKVPQSIWVKQVLSGLGHGQILLFEIPAFPVTALASLGEAFEAAKRAHHQFLAGEYDLCVGLCRTAVQPLRNHLKKIKAMAGDGTAADWAEKVGDATFEWLTIVTGKTHGMGSAAVHEGSPGRFTRLDAQMILTTTISILAYAARLERSQQ